MHEPDPDQLLRHSGFVRAVAHSLLHDEARAEDVVQETWIAALQRRPRGALRPWLASVARALSISAWRSDRRREARERVAARVEALPSAADAAQRLEAHQRVVDAVRALPEPYRSTVLYRYFYELEIAEIALRTDTPVETVRTRLRRALTRLRASLDAGPGEQRAGRPLLLPLLADYAWKGGLVMGTKAKLTVAALLLLALLLALHFLPRADPPPARRSPPGGARAAATPSDTNSPAESHPPEPIDRARDIYGEVVDPAGTPVPGATVTVLFVGRGTSGPETRTDIHGAFRLRVEPGDLVDVQVLAEGFAPKRWGMVNAGERLRLMMTASVTLEVRVLGPGGDPLDDASVAVEASRRRGGVVVDEEARTGEEGCARIDHLPAGAEIAIHAFHAAWGWIRAMHTVGSSGPDVATLRFAEPGRVFRGVVLDRETGSPVVGAQVLANGRIPLTTDAEGAFAAPVQEAYGLALEVRAPGYVPRAGTFEGEGARIELSRGVRVYGVLVDARGRRVGGAALRLWSFAGGRVELVAISGREARSGDDGSFSFDVEPSAAAHSLVVRADGYGRRHVDFEVDGDRDLGNIGLPPARVLSGRVVDDTGAPCPRLRIELRGSNRDRGSLRGGRRLPPPAEWLDAQELRYTDDIGRFVFPDLAPGTYELAIAAEGRPPHTEVYVVPADRDVRDLLVRLSATNAFTVTVVEAGGAPVEGAFVFAGGAQGRTGPQGVAQFRLTTAPQKIQVTAPDGYLPVPAQEVAEGVGSLRVVVQRAGRVSGTVVGPDGPLPDRPLLEARRGDSVVSTAYAAADGSFEVPVPQNGTVDLVLGGRVANGGNAFQQEGFYFTGALRGVAAGEAGLVLRARPVGFDRAVRVRVVTPAGDPVEGASLYAYPAPNEKGLLAAVTDAQGIADLDGLPERTVTLVYGDTRRAEELGLAPPAECSRRLAPGTGELVFTLRARVRVRGAVVLPDGTPGPALLYVFVDGTFLAPPRTAGPDGRFEAWVPAGFERIVIQASWQGRSDAGEVRYRGQIEARRCDEELLVRLEPAR